MKKNFFIKSVFFLIFLLSTFSIFSQNNTSSPYSMFGIGDLENKKFGISNAMGGVGIGVRNPYILNFTNPASYSSMDTLTFLFSVGIKNKITISETENDETLTNDMNLHHLSFGFPVIFKKWYVSCGLLPYSSIGYDINYNSETDNNDDIKYTYQGVGNLNKVYFTNTFLLKEKFSFGLNASYMFGSIEKIKLVQPEDINSWDLKTNRKTQISDVFFDFGFQYTDSLKDFEYTLGFTFANKTELKAEVNKVSEQSFFNLLDTLENSIYEKGDITLPNSFGLGFILRKKNKTTWGIDFAYENWKESKFFGENNDLENSFSLMTGGEYVPNYRSIKYFQRVKYRYGAHFSKSYLKLNGENIFDYGLSFGFGFPLSRKKSTINISFAIGQRGTTKQNLIKESYAVININFSLHENWFTRRQFN